MQTQTTEEIVIQVDKETAKAFRSAPTEKKKKIQFLLNLWLREVETDATKIFPGLQNPFKTQKERLDPSVSLLWPFRG